MKQFDFSFDLTNFHFKITLMGLTTSLMFWLGIILLFFYQNLGEIVETFLHEI